MSFNMAENGLPLAAVGDLEAHHFQTARMFDRSTNLQFCTSAPIAAKGC
jgi:hypothetical protein